MLKTFLTSDTGFVNQLINKSDNNIVFFIIAIGFLLVVGVPFYNALRKSKKEAVEAQLNEKKMLLSVVEKNTAAITSLNNSIDVNNEAMSKFLKSIDERTFNTVVKLDNIDGQQDRLLDILDKFLARANEDERIKNEIGSAVDSIKHSIATMNDKIIELEIVVKERLPESKSK